MIVPLEILASAAIFAQNRIEDLMEKDLIPNMMFRRRLSRNSKMLIYLSDKLNIKNERIVYGSNYGELKESISILKNIFASVSPSPNDFQNSVYNTPSAYLSILFGNKSEILCVSNGDDTGECAIKTAAIKSMDGDLIFLALCESFDIEEIQKINNCNAVRESAAAFTIKKSDKKPDILFSDLLPSKNFAPSIAKIMSLYTFLRENPKVVVGVKC